MNTTKLESVRPSAFLAEEGALREFARQERRHSGGHRAVNAVPSDPFILAPGALVAGRYEVGPIIGAGALGIVYKARHLELGRLVALKVIRPDIAHNASAWRHFSREARALSGLHHEHIVRIHDTGTLDSGLRYLVMDLLEGSTLRGRLDSGPVPPRQAVDLALQVCSALSDAHGSNIIHRDVRPENIYLARYRGSESSETESSVKLLDFGMAIFLDDARECTATRRVAAAPDYLSPEQLLNAYAVDARSDLWAVGMVLYEMVAGRTPFGGKNTLQTCLQIAGGTIPRIETLSPEVPAGVAAAIHRCLQVDPALRPASAEELGRELEPFSSRHAQADGTQDGSSEAPILLTAAQRIKTAPRAPSRG